MADYSNQRPELGKKDYAVKIDSFISAVELDITNIQNAEYASMPDTVVVDNIPSVDINGNLVDSGIAKDSVPQQAGNLVNGMYLMADSNGKIVDSQVPVATSQNYWESPPNTYMYSYSSTSGSHPLNVIPKSYTLWLVCLVDDVKWIVGDRLGIYNNELVVSFTTTSWKFYYPSSIINIPDKTYGNQIKHPAAEGKWGIIMGVQK